MKYAFFSENPKISVLLPFYNAEATLSIAIDSIIGQTFDQWELVLVNNGSADASTEIAETYAKTDKRIMVVCEPEVGIVNALNTGLKNCNAPLIARMDADDIALLKRLELQYAFMQQHSDTDVVSGLVEHMADSDSNTDGFRNYVSWINGLIEHKDIDVNRFIESPLCHPSVMFRRASLDKYGHYADGDFPEDYEMWLRWLHLGAKFAKVNEKVLIWKDSPLRLSRNNTKYSKVAFNNIRLQYLDMWLKANNPFYPEFITWGAGKMGRKLSKILIDKGHINKGFIDVSYKKARQLDCMHYTDIPKAGGCFIVNFVGIRGTAKLIRQEICEKGYCEGFDFIMAAGI